MADLHTRPHGMQGAPTAHQLESHILGHVDARLD
jgi:hypothetical protein